MVIKNYPHWFLTKIKNFKHSPLYCEGCYLALNAIINSIFLLAFELLQLKN